MFGFGKNKRMQRLWETIGAQLRNCLAFPRGVNDGRVPNSLKEDHYVIGFHFMLCLNFYVESVKGKTDPEEQGFVLINALAIALDSNGKDVGAILEPLMANPDESFTLGTEHANTAYEKVGQGDTSALEEFNRNIRGKYST